MTPEVCEQADTFNILLCAVSDGSRGDSGAFRGECLTVVKSWRIKRGNEDLPFLNWKQYGPKYYYMTDGTDEHHSL